MHDHSLFSSYHFSSTRELKKQESQPTTRRGRENDGRRRFRWRGTLRIHRLSWYRTVRKSEKPGTGVSETIRGEKRSESTRREMGREGNFELAFACRSHRVSNCETNEDGELGSISQPSSLREEKKLTSDHSLINFSGILSPLNSARWKFLGSFFGEKHSNFVSRNSLLTKSKMGGESK